MIRDSLLKVLWISDMHFSEKYKKLKDDPAFKKFMDGFLSCVTTENTRDRRTLREPFDYLLLSGDLAQVGSDGDYGQFNALFLDPLMDCLAKGDNMPNVITIPGNHDIQRKESPMLSTFTEVVTTTKKDGKRAGYLKDNETEFKKLFQGYSTFLNNAKTGPHGALFDLEKSKTIKVYEEYSQTGLYGFIVDHSHQLIFVMLNSAWYSLGGSFNGIYAAQILKALEKERSGMNVLSRPGKGRYQLSPKQLEDWLKTKDLLSDYSNQVSGIQLLKNDELSALFEKYPDYFVITTMHHPRNWMHYGESYSHYPEDRNSSAYLLNKLIRDSDVLLTGHEHVPVTTDAERLLEKILHLKAGCFLTDNQHEETNFEISWFSVLNINISKREVDQRRYYWRTAEESWEVRDHKFLPAERVFVGRLLPERKREILKMISKRSLEQIAAFLSADDDTPVSKSDLITLRKDAKEPIDWYTFRGDRTHELCLFAREEEVFSKLYSNPEFLPGLIRFLEDQPEITHVRFLTVDFLVDHACSSAYDNECDFFAVLNQIARKAENYFNVLRHNFFTGAINKNVSPRVFDKISFLNEVIPFWIAEKYWFTG